MQPEKMNGLEKILALFTCQDTSNWLITDTLEDDDTEWDAEFWIIRDRPPYRV